METICRETLYYKAGTSDKEYTVTIQRDSKWLHQVICYFGRRGGTQQTHDRGAFQTLAEARDMFRSALNEKLRKGYSMSMTGSEVAQAEARLATIRAANRAFTTPSGGNFSGTPYLPTPPSRRTGTFSPPPTPAPKPKREPQPEPHTRTKRLYRFD